MTNESLHDLILAYNTDSLSSYSSFRSLSSSVMLGYVWIAAPSGMTKFESSKKIYFILEKTNCIGAVLEMGPSHSGNPLE